MAELLKGVRLASGYLCRKGWRRDMPLPLSRWGYRGIELENLSLKMLFIEIHIYPTLLHLAGTTTYA